MIPTRQTDSAFLRFKQQVSEAVEKNPKLLRLDCLNPVKAIPHEFSDYVPNISIDAAWKNFLKLDYKHFFYTSGVRDSLRQLLPLLKDRTIAIPQDVYPVYQVLAAENDTVEYHALPYFRIEEALLSSVVLLTFPFMARDLMNPEIDELCEWLKADPNRLLIIDRVYDYQNWYYIQKLIDTNQVILLYSLSKTFLSPNVMGLAIVPEAYKIETEKNWDEEKAKSILAHVDFPAKQTAIFRYRWSKLGYSRCSSYARCVQRDAKSFLNDNTLAVPAEVYNVTNPKSNEVAVITCLHESNAFNDLAVVDRYYVTVLSNFSRGFDKYSLKYSKDNIPESTYKDKFFLLSKDQIQIGFDKAKHLATETDRLIVIKTSVPNYELVDAHKGCYVERNWIKVDRVCGEEFLNGYFNEILVEDAYSESLALNDLMDWNQVAPRSLSILPIASSCQAKCSFCFSHSSISDDLKQGGLDLIKFEETCVASKEKGANRLVITGGGEPTMLAHAKLLKIMEIGKKYFNKIVMITNGYNLGHADLEERRTILREYKQAGLTNLSVSRHSHDNNTKIMSLETKSENISEALGDDTPSLRWVCVLQKYGIDSERKIAEYLDWVTTTAATEVCFKELYVAAMKESVYASTSYNDWCREHQVTMSLVSEFLIKNQAEKIAELPWGSPIYTLNWGGKELKIAVYTEPSIYWERKNGVCRSWNYMADNKCYANLETKASLL
jgi:hypothetical protein